jgi:hypothetical protein
MYPQDRETDEQRMERENANATRAVRCQQELAAAALATGQHAGNAAQGDGNVGMQAPAALLTVNFRQPRVLVIHWFLLWFATNPPLGILMM